jgi:hypothetical protein
MMTFKFSDETHFATNSIKPCSITKFEDDYYELHMPKGDHAVTFPVKLGFDTFNEAKRWAEERVGMHIQLGKEI